MLQLASTRLFCNKIEIKKERWFLGTVEVTGARGVDGVEEEIIRQKLERQQLKAKALEDPEAFLDLANKTPQNSFNSNYASLPQNAKDSFDKYDASGWSGSLPGQTPGTAAGGRHLNRDRKLPSTDNKGNTITYKEFDVNNKLPNQCRDAERFVAGSDGSVYYTKDHYGTFMFFPT